jgi:hypothetical protein
MLHMGSTLINVRRIWKWMAVRVRIGMVGLVNLPHAILGGMDRGTVVVLGVLIQCMLLLVMPLLCCGGRRVVCIVRVLSIPVGMWVMKGLIMLRLIR